MDVDENCSGRLPAALALAWATAAAIFLCGFAPTIATATSDELPLESGVNASVAKARVPTMRETAIRTIGVAPFTGRVADPNGFAKAISDALAFKSYFVSRALTRAMGPATARDQIVSEASGANLDAVLLGEVDHEEGLVMRLSSGASGRGLETIKVPINNVPGDAGQRGAIVDRIVDAVVRSIPYRGYVVKVNGGDGIVINLGSQHGLLPGMRLKIFEFVGDPPSFRSERSQLAEIEITAVRGPAVSVARLVSGKGPVEPFSKIGFDDRTIAMVSETEEPLRNWVFVGGHVLSIGGDAAPQYSRYVYTLSSTPSAAVGIGIGRFELRALYGQAKNSELSVAYTEAIALLEVWRKTSGFTDYIFGLGARYGAFNATSVAATQGEIQSTSAISPAFSVGLEHSLRSRTKLFANLQVYWPIFNSGSGSSPIFSSGGGLNVGGRVELNRHVGVELGGTLKFFRRLVDGESSVQDRQSSIYGGLVFMF